MKMSKTVTSFVIGFLFVMHALGDFTTPADRQGKEGLLMTGKHQALSDHEEVIGRISDEESRMIVGLGGRKMAAAQKAVVLLRNGEIGSPKNSGATCDHHFEARKGDIINVKCKLGKSTRAKKKLKVAHHDHDHFVAFGADYHGPSRHPPKHN